MIKKIFMAAAVAASFTACTNDDYKEWADLKTNPQGTVVEFGNGSITEVPTINFADYAADGAKVKVCDITEAPSVKDEAYKFNHYDLLINGEVIPTADGSILAADLQKMFTDTYGKRPVERELTAQMVAYFDNDTKPLKFASEKFTVKGIPVAPVIYPNLYVIGAPSAWDPTCTTLKFTHSGNDVYDDPIFTVMFPVADGDTWFAFADDKTVETADWSNVFGCIEGNGQNPVGSEGKLARRSELTDDGSFMVHVDGDAKFVKVTVNMLDGTYLIEKVNFGKYLWAPGEANGWNQGEASRIVSQNYDGIYEGFIYAKGGFKFTTQNNWDGTNYGWGADATSLSDDPGAGNLWLSDDAAVYYVHVDIVNKVYSATKVENMSLIGDFNGWGGDVELAWDADNLCFTGDCSAVTSAGWKFRVNHDWAINLGGDDCSNLWNGGPNLTATGSTVKLYPTRKGSADNIYCTVE